MIKIMKNNKLNLIAMHISLWNRVTSVVVLNWCRHLEAGAGQQAPTETPDGQQAGWGGRVSHKM